jgi:hypothetical protein
MATAVDPSNAVQAAIVAALTGAPSVAALLPGGVHDEVPEGETRDYVVVSDRLSLPDHTHTTFGRELTFTLHIWTRARGTKRGGAIAAAITALLDHTPDALVVAGHRVVEIRNEFQQAVKDPDPSWRQVILRFRINTTQE